MLARLKEFAVTKVIDPVVAALPANARRHLANHALRPESLKVMRGLDRESLASLFLEGDGIEIGAMNNPLKVPERARVRYVDYRPAEELRALYPGIPVKEPDIVADGARLEVIPDGSQDFVIACHLIEHIEDPVGAIKNWLRVLKDGGILFVAIPDKRLTFDVEREPTPLEHLFDDHEHGPEASRLEHFREFHRVVLGLTDEEEVRRLAAEEDHTHFHCWGPDGMLELAAGLLRYGLSFEVLAFASYGNEGTFVLRKGERDCRAHAQESLSARRSAVR